MPKLTQNFTTDFDALTAGLAPDYAGEPYAFSRFGDGEASIMQGVGHRAKSDHWEFRNSAEIPLLLMAGLRDAALYSSPGYHIGVIAEDRSAQQHEFLLSLARRTPLERITYAGIFIFSNFKRWQEKNISHCCVVSSHATADIRVPPHPTAPTWFTSLNSIVAKMQAEQRPILLAAGPWACVLVHRYWADTPPARRQVVIDVGSAIELSMSKRRTRRYHNPRHPNADWVPAWKADAESLPAEEASDAFFSFE